MNDEITSDSAPVLFVDDDELYALVVRHAWLKLETNVPLKWLDDGKGAISYLEGTVPGPGRRVVPRLIITDLNMPGLDGLELLQWIRRNSSLKDLPVIVISGSANPHDVEDAYALGANLYMEKPRGLEETIDMLRALERFWLGEVETSTKP